LQALILVGGHGTRLRPITLTLPKPVVPLVDRPFLRYMIDWVARHGVDEVVMACGFLPDQLRATLGDQIPGGPRLRYVEEPEPRGTAGAIKFAEDLLEDRFFALNGDSLTDLDLTALLDKHIASGARATLGVHPVDDITGLGLVRSGEDGRILEFLEKPDPATVDTNEVSAGMYVLEKEVLDLVPADQDVSIEREVWPRLVGDGLYSQRLEGYWMDIGTPERYLDACWDILDQRVQSEPGEMVDEEGRFVSPVASVDGGATVAGESFVEADCEIAAGARIGPRAILGAGVSVGADATVTGSALHPACRVGEGAAVTGAILSAGTTVEPGAVVPEGAVIGAGAIITASAALQPGARVQPEETV
jgi:mannose-1-phosphate guanylyltransferase